MNHRYMQYQAKSRIGIYFSAVVWIGMAAAAIAAADRSNAPRASSEGEGMRTNSVLLNGDWEFSTGDGSEHAETPDGASRLKWQTVNLPGRFMPWNNEVAANTRFVWTRRTFTVSAAQAACLAVLRWNQISSGAAAFINGRKVGENAPTGPYQVLLPAGELRTGENTIVLKVTGAAAVPRARSGSALIPAGFGPGMPAVPGDVWIDFADSAYMKWILALPDLAGSKVRIRVTLTGVEPAEGAAAGDGRIEPRGGAQQFKAPFTGDAVLYLKAQSK